MAGKSKLSRRDFIKWGGVAAAGAGLVTIGAKNVLMPVAATAAPDAVPDIHFGGTDGWIWLPETPAIPPFHPDTYAPAPFTTYVFGFHNITGLSPTQIANQKNKAQHSAPMFWLKKGQEFRVKLTNLGLAQRPDLFDAHTVHFHGFRDVIPFFDGEPSGSVAVPANSEFTYVYKPNDAGTYMFHCHVEDTEHVQMGMTGLVFIKPAQGDNFIYDDDGGTTQFHREFGMILSEVWAEAHWADAHIQLPEWTDYRADFSMLNGRVYPDTIGPHAPLDPTATAFNSWRFVHFDHNEAPGEDTDGDLLAPDGRPELQYQPLSSLITCNAGEKVALRLANLGYKQSAMTLTGIPMRVVGKDATFLTAPYDTDTLMLGAGESIEAIFTAPPHSGGPDPDRYVLYNRAYTRSNNLAPGGFGGQATEVWVYPTGSLPAQRFPNDYGSTVNP
ncbi:MAG: multicopper oxidase domain-containing protein [Actinomycetota bacterium]